MSFRFGVEVGKSTACPWCGIRAANQHSLKESGTCDGVKAYIAGDLKQEDATETVVRLAGRYREMKLAA